MQIKSKYRVKAEEKFRLGFTLIEIFFAMLIGLIVFLGLLAGAFYVQKLSVGRALQYDAVRILHQRLEQIREMNYDAISEVALNNGAADCADALTSGKNVVVRYVGNRPFKFGLYYKVDENKTLLLKEVALTVCWNYAGRFHSLSGTTIVRKEK